MINYVDFPKSEFQAIRKLKKKKIGSVVALKNNCLFLANNTIQISIST